MLCHESYTLAKKKKTPANSVLHMHGIIFTTYASIPFFAIFLRLCQHPYII